MIAGVQPSTAVECSSTDHVFILHWIAFKGCWAEVCFWSWLLTKDVCNWTAWTSDSMAEMFWDYLGNDVPDGHLTTTEAYTSECQEDAANHHDWHREDRSPLPCTVSNEIRDRMRNHHNTSLWQHKNNITMRMPVSLLQLIVWKNFVPGLATCRIHSAMVMLQGFHWSFSWECYLRQVWYFYTSRHE